MITNLHINNIEISGRLGNNLFQIALLIGLKEKYGSNYFIPTWRHSKDFPNVLCNEKISLKPNKFYNEPKYCHNEIHSMLNETKSRRLNTWNVAKKLKKLFRNEFANRPKPIILQKKEKKKFTTYILKKQDGNLKEGICRRDVFL
jgi:hypothetical protein